jgi:hypothetical protein
MSYLAQHDTRDALACTEQSFGWVDLRFAESFLQISRICQERSTMRRNGMKMLLMHESSHCE